MYETFMVFNIRNKSINFFDKNILIESKTKIVQSIQNNIIDTHET